LNNPTNPKMNKINMENKGFVKRIKKCIGGVNLMKAAGFVEKRGGFLSIPRINKENLSEWIAILGDYVENKVIVVE